MEITSLHFAALARTIAGAARSRGLEVPGFRTPPRRPGIVRTVRRAGGGATVAVVARGRPVQAVVADLIEGVMVVNQLDGVEAARLRTVLWEEVVTAHPSEVALPGAA
jgi:hypothetical protein